MLVMPGMVLPGLMCALSEWAEGLEGLKSEIDQAPGLYPRGNPLIPNLVPSLRLKSTEPF